MRAYLIARVQKKTLGNKLKLTAKNDHQTCRQFENISENRQHQGLFDDKSQQHKIAISIFYYFK